MQAIIYHNPRCSKSRQTLSLLRDKGVNVTIVDYLAAPLARDEIEELLRKSGLHARDIVRESEPVYRELGLGDSDVDDAALLDAIASHPILLQRPIVVAGDRAVIGRPPQNVNSLFE
jgi:arsenate reductase (glutaredoxin)